MAYGYPSGGYIAPPRKPKLAPALGSYPILGGGTDTFGLTRPRGIDVGGLFPAQPKPYTPPKPRVQTTAGPAAPSAPAGPPTADTSFDPGTRPNGAALYSLETDPALAQVYAYAGRADSEARAQALRDKQQLVERAGLSDLAGALGLGGDVATVAAQNPFSSAANLKHDFQLAADQLSKQKDQNTRDFNEQANQQNLFYSGYRGTELGRLADAFKTAQSENTRAYQGGLQSLADTVQGQIGGIDSQLAAALGASLQSKLGGEQAARDRQIQLALSQGYTFGGFDDQGNPIFNPPSSSGNAGGAASETAANTGGTAAPNALLLALANAAQDQARKRAASGYLGPVGGPRLAAGF